MRKIVITIIILLSLQGMSFGQSLDEYLRIAAENNPELRASFSDYLAAMEQIPQVGALPDPEISMGFFIQPMERFMGRQQADVQLMQMFPWFGMLRTRKDEAGKMALARYEVFQDVQNRLFYQIKNTWYEMYRLEEEVRITKENLDILETYERLALIRFQSPGNPGAGSGSMQGGSSGSNSGTSSSGTSMGQMGGGTGMAGSSGTGSATNTSRASSSMNTSGAAMSSGGSGMSDVLRVRMEIKELKNRLAFLQDSRLPLEAEFNQLLNRDYNEAVFIADTLSDTPLSMDRKTLLDSINLNNPMLKMLDAEAEAYEAQKKMARLEGRPMFGAGINYIPFSARSENGVSMGGEDMIMPMVRLSLPIYRKKYNAMLKEAELKQQAVHQRKRNLGNQLSVQWSTTLRNLDDADRRTTLYREQAALARQTLNLLMTAYTAEGRDFEEVLRVQQQLLDYQLKLITAIVDQHTSIALLENLAATELD